MTINYAHFFIDQSGKVRIWDTTQKEHILKNEFQPLGGAIKDINWSDDSQRIAVAGEGKEKYCHFLINFNLKFFIHRRSLELTSDQN